LIVGTLDKAVSTQIENIQKKTGKSLEALAAIVAKSGLSKHGEIRDFLKESLALGHGDANALVHAIHASDGTRAAAGKEIDSILDEIYTGPKAGFRGIHDTLIKAIDGFGPYEIVPKKGYVSLRRKKQFAMIGPKTNTRFEVGINARELGPNPRLLPQPKGSMCPWIVIVTSKNEVDAELKAWLEAAFQEAG
jgi:hypothetical protein